MVKKIKKRSTVVLGIVFCLMLLCSVSLTYSRQKQQFYVHNEDDIVAEIPEDELKENTASGDEINILDFRQLSEVTPYVVIDFEDDVKSKTYYDIYGYTTEDFLAPSIVFGAVTYSQSGYGVIDINDIGGVLAIGIPYETDGLIESIEFHSKDPEYTYKNDGFEVGKFIVLFVLSALATGLLYYAERKYRTIDTVLDAIAENKSSILRFIKEEIIIVGIAFVLEYILKTVLIHLGISSGFRINRFFFIFGVMLAARWLYLMRKVYESNTQRVFLGYILIIGITLIVVSPFGHAGWDIDSHYGLSLTASYLGEENQTLTDLLITNARMASLVKGSYDENVNTIMALDSSYGNILDTAEASISIAHIPAGIGLALGRFLGLPFFIMFYMGEIMNLLVYSALGYLAIRKLKSGKFILASIIIIPTNVFMASCFNYDYWVLGFSFLGVAYYVSACQNGDERISYKDEIIMCLCLMLSCIPKQIYLPILFLPFLMPWKKIENKIKYYSIACVPFVLVAMSFLFRTLTEVNETGDIRGGSDINPMEQVHYILSHKGTFLRTMYDFVKGALSLGYEEKAITNYANLGYYEIGANIILIMIFVVAFLDKKECDISLGNWKNRLFAITFYLAEVMFISLAFYLVFTAVGSDTVSGVQARYFTPMLYPLLAVIGSGRIKIKFDRNYLGYAVFGIEFVVLFIGMLISMLRRLV